MKKIIFTAILAVLIILITGCDNRNYRLLEPSAANYNSQLDINSPEGLAKTTSLIYKDIADEKITVDQAMDKLISYASGNSMEEIFKNKEKFRKGIADYIDYMKSNGDKLVRFEFSKTVYDNPKSAHIERIQVQKNNDKKYYFIQDFVLENGTWRVQGDNMSEPFKIKWIFSKNYILK
jgi:uncharacterized lipoprotein NlpE involved in copper resistance